MREAKRWGRNYYPAAGSDPGAAPPRRRQGNGSCVLQAIERRPRRMAPLSSAQEIAATLRGGRANALRNGLPLLALRGMVGVADFGDVRRGDSPRVEDSFFRFS